MKTVPKMLEKNVYRKNKTLVDKIVNQYRYVNKTMNFESVKIEEFYDEVSTKQIRENFRNSMKIVILYSCGSMLIDDLLYPEETSRRIMSLSCLIFNILCYFSTMFLHSNLQLEILNTFVVLGIMITIVLGTLENAGKLEINFTPSLQLTVLMFSYLPMKLNNAIMMWALIFAVYLSSTVFTLDFKKSKTDIYSIFYNYSKLDFRSIPMFDENTDIVRFTLAIICLSIAFTMSCMYLHFVKNFHGRSSFIKLGLNLQVKSQIRSAIKMKHNWLDAIMPKIVKDQYLENIDEIKKTDWLFIKKFNNVSVLFGDLVGFTRFTANKSASRVVALLNDLFNRFNDLCNLTNVEKLSTLGDCYYCVAGIPVFRSDHAISCIEMGLGMCRAVEHFNLQYGENVNMQIGIHSGQVIAAILGKIKFRFDIYSNDVNIAKIIESTGKPGRVHISESVYAEVRDNYVFEIGPNVEITELEIDTEGRRFSKVVSIKTYFIDSKIYASPTKKFIEPDNKFKRYSFIFKNSEYSEDSDEEANVNPGKVLPPLDREAYRNMIKVDVEFIEVMQFDSDQKINFLNNPPIHIFSMNFADREIEWHFKTCDSNYGNESDLDITKLTPLLDAFVCFVYSLFIYISYFILFPDISWKGYVVVLLKILLSISILIILTWVCFDMNCDLKVSTFNRIKRLVSSQTVRALICLYFVSTPLFISTNLTNCKKLKIDYHYTIRYFTLIIFSIYILPLFFSVNYFVKLIVCVMYFIYELLVLIKLPCAELQLNYTVVFYSCLGQNNVTNITFWKTLSYCYIFQILLSCVLMMFVVRDIERNTRALFYMTRELEINNSEVTKARANAEESLTNIIPKYVLSYLKILPKNQKELTNFSYAISIPNAAVLFARIGNFVYQNDFKSGKKSIKLLHLIISSIDEMSLRPIYKDVEKIKTINDSYIVASGLNLIEVTKNPNKHEHLYSLMYFAFEIMTIIDFINENFVSESDKIDMIIGYNAGPLTSGIIGKMKPMYDIWGDTVNLSNRMCTNSRPNKILVPQNVQDQLKQEFFFDHYSNMMIKNQIKIETYFCIGPVVNDEISNKYLGYGLSTDLINIILFDKRDGKGSAKRPFIKEVSSLTDDYFNNEKRMETKYYNLKPTLSMFRSAKKSLNFGYTGFAFP